MEILAATQIGLKMYTDLFETDFNNVFRLVKILAKCYEEIHGICQYISVEHKKYLHTWIFPQSVDILSRMLNVFVGDGT